MKKYKNRNSVEEKYKWDLSEYFQDEQSFYETYHKTEENIEKLNTYVGCTKDAKRLYEFLQLQVETISDWEDLYVYAYLVNDQELGVAESIERKNQNNRAMQTRSSIGLPFYEYCIITRDSLISSFERIIAWKRTKGIDAGAVSIESILSNSYCSGDTVSGINDDAGKVRQYLQYAHLSG